LTHFQANFSRAEYATVFAVVPALLFGGRAVSYVLFLWLLLRLASSVVSGSWGDRLRLEKMWAWMVAYFSLQLIATLWSEDVSAAQFSWEVKASFFVVPLIVALPGALSPSDLRRVLAQGVVYSTAGYLLLRLALGVSDASSGFGGLYYAGLAGDVHPTYLALYAAVALAFLTEILPNAVRIRNVLAFFFLLCIGLLSSKAGVIAALPAIYFFSQARSEHKSKSELMPFSRRLLMGIACTAVLAGSAYLAGGDRFSELATAVEAVEAMESGSGQTPVVQSSSSGRVAVWRSAAELLVQHPLGVGTGDVEAELNALYVRDGIDYALDRRLNPHNQWLQAGVAFGWPGVLIWSALLIIGWCLARKKGDTVLLAFICILGLHACFESVLEAQRGVVFIAMALAVLARD